MGITKTDDMVIHRGMAPIGSYVGVLGSQVGGIIWEGLDGRGLAGECVLLGAKFEVLKETHAAPSLSFSASWLCIRMKMFSCSFTDSNPLKP